jgi:hypothetical protein
MREWPHFQSGTPRSLPEATLTIANSHSKWTRVSCDVAGEGDNIGPRADAKAAPDLIKIAAVRGLYGT